MNNRTVAVGGIVAVLIVAVWWLFFFSPARSDASKASKEVSSAKAHGRELEIQDKQLQDLERHAPQIKADRDRLRRAIPETPELGTFIAQMNQLAAAAGVKWVSVGPQEPAAGTPSGTTQVTIDVEGGYYQVLDYVHGVETFPRLVVVDGLSVNKVAASGTDVSGQTLHATLTARMFNQASSTSAAGSTTPTSVAGGGGVAAPQSGQGS